MCKIMKKHPINERNDIDFEFYSGYHARGICYFRRNKIVRIGI